MGILDTQFLFTEPPIRNAAAVSTPAPRTLTAQSARRLAIAAQKLSQDTQAETILDLIRAIGCLQLDPISAVARSHQLVLWSRLGAYDVKEFERLMWHDRHLFEYWAHAASIVLTEDFPIHAAMMRRDPDDSAWGRRTSEWLEANAALRDHILGEIRARGPLASRDFEDKSTEGWASTGWTSGRNVSRMIDFLWIRGDLMVAGRRGLQKLWDLSERWLPPEWTAREALQGEALTYEAAQKAIRALGIARANHIPQHYTRGRYPHLTKVLPQLVADGRVVPVGVESWPGEWLIHADLLPLLDRIEAGEWNPRTVLLSPFDNLIADRKRTEQMFDFRYRIEIYVPKDKREFGYYVLPILHGDRLIGRIDPMMNRRTKALAINAVYAEPDAPTDAATGKAVASTIQDLAGFLGAKSIAYTERVPSGWRKALRST